MRQISCACRSGAAPGPAVGPAIRPHNAPRKLCRAPRQAGLGRRRSSHPPCAWCPPALPAPCCPLRRPHGGAQAQALVTWLGFLSASIATAASCWGCPGGQPRSDMPYPSITRNLAGAACAARTACTASGAGGVGGDATQATFGVAPCARHACMRRTNAVM